MTGSLRVQDTAATHVGLVRSENEDSMASLAGQGVWLVADGMGGHSHGKFASQTIADVLNEASYAIDPLRPWEAVAQAIHEANRRIFARAGELGQQMGSTVVALVLHAQQFSVLWAGDSRAYLLRNGALFQLTRDHTQVEMMLERGLLTPAEALDHPMKHVLARAVGVQETLELDAIQDLAEPHDVFLLCSDGLYGVVDDAQIAALLRDHGAKAGEALIAAALAGGGPDNVTVMLVAVSEPTLLVLNGVER